MAITVKPDPVEFDLTDYFSKFGFGDGDDSILQDLAHTNRELVIGFLNEEFTKAALPLKAEGYEGSSIHNNCRIDIKRTDQDVEIDWDYDLEKTMGGLKKKFDLALSAVELRVHQKFQSRENKGTYKPRRVV